MLSLLIRIELDKIENAYKLKVANVNVLLS